MLPSTSRPHLTRVQDLPRRNYLPPVTRTWTASSTGVERVRRKRSKLSGGRRVLLDPPNRSMAGVHPPVSAGM